MMAGWRNIAIVALMICTTAQAADAPADAAAASIPIKDYKPSVVVDVVRIRDDDPDIVRLALPANDPATWVTAADYPELAKADRIHAVPVLSIHVGADGSLTQCEATIGSSTHKSVVALTEADRIDWKALACALVSRRGQFKPAMARDRTSRPGQLRVYINFDMVSPIAPMSGGLASMVRPPELSGIWPPAYPAWGINPVKWPKLDQRVPRVARVSWNGSTGVVLDVNNAGKVVDCSVRSKSESPEMDQLSCDGLSAARFSVPRPLSFENGHNHLPVVVEWSNGKATFRAGINQKRLSRVNADVLTQLNALLTANYPAEAKAVQAQGVTTVEVAADAQGIVQRCLVTATAGNDYLDLAACELVSRTAGLVQPGTDVFGRAVAGRVGGIDLDWKLLAAASR